VLSSIGAPNAVRIFVTSAFQPSGVRNELFMTM